jgi:hypothetical protein
METHVLKQAACELHIEVAAAQVQQCLFGFALPDHEVVGKVTIRAPRLCFSPRIFHPNTNRRM